MEQLVLAAQLLTILPLPEVRDVSAADLGRSLRYYPLIGLGLGAVLVAAQYALSKRLAPLPTAAVVLVLLVVLSGALHWDGVADLCDGFYKGKDKSEILAIMKDSHCGAMAIVAIVCLFALKLSFLASLPPAWLWKSLLLMPVAGRWGMVLLAAGSGYARGEGTAKAYVDHAGFPEAAIAALITVTAAGLVMGAAGLIMMTAVSLMTLAFRRYVISKIGGVTGDVLGACGELSECAFLLLACLSSGVR